MIFRRAAIAPLLMAGWFAAAPALAPAQQPALTPTPAAVGSPRPLPVCGEGPFAAPVPGHPGFVYSPYAPDAGSVDVRGFQSGTAVRCPYTNKLFLVP